MAKHIEEGNKLALVATSPDEIKAADWLTDNLPGFLTRFKDETALTKCQMLSMLQLFTDGLHHNLHAEDVQREGEAVH